MSIPTWVEIVNKLATPAVAATSAFYVYLQYKRGQRWKANDLAIALLEKLQKDDCLALACHALDWGVGPLIIPDQYRPLFPSSVSGKGPAVMQHDPNVLSLAVEPKLNSTTLSDPRGLVYRYCFIKLFDYLDNMFKLLANGQLRNEDVDEVRYWLERLADYPYALGHKKGTEVFQPALREWGYTNVISLGERLKVASWNHPKAA